MSSAASLARNSGQLSVLQLSTLQSLRATLTPIPLPDVASSSLAFQRGSIAESFPKRRGSMPKISAAWVSLLSDLVAIFSALVSAYYVRFDFLRRVLPPESFFAPTGQTWPCELYGEHRLWRRAPFIASLRERSLRKPDAPSLPPFLLSAFQVPSCLGNRLFRSIPDP